MHPLQEELDENPGKANQGGAAPSFVHTSERFPGKLRNRVLEEALAEDPAFGRRNYHRRYAARIARLANRAQMGQLAANIGGCSTELVLGTNGRLIGRRACRARWCPICQASRAVQWAGRLHEAMPVIVAAHPQWRFIMLTVTVRSVPLAELRTTLREMHHALDRLTKRKKFAPLGWIRCTEVTINPATGLAHPHIHILGAVEADYFARPWHKVRGATGRPRIVSGYMTKDEWAAEWQIAAKLDYWPVLDVRAVPENISGARARRAVYEVTKYGAKPGDVAALEPDRFALLAQQMHGARTIGVGGALASYLRIVEESDDLAPIEAPPEVQTVARWDADAKRYHPDGPATAAAQDRRLALWRSAIDDRAARAVAASPAIRALTARALRRGGLSEKDVTEVRGGDVPRARKRGPAALCPITTLHNMRKP